MSIEYGLIVALVVVALLAALPTLNTATVAMYNKIQNAMANSAH